MVAAAMVAALVAGPAFPPPGFSTQAWSLRIRPTSLPTSPWIRRVRRSPRHTPSSRSATRCLWGVASRTPQNAKRTTTYERHNIMAFDATTGQMQTSHQTWNGWLLGSGGFSRRALCRGEISPQSTESPDPLLAKLDPVTGELDASFQPAITGGRVIRDQVGEWSATHRVAASRGSLSALNPLTGKNTGYIDAAIAGSLPLSTDKVEVFKFAVDPSGTRLVGVGDFTTVNGVNRQRAFMLNLDAEGDSLSEWYYPPLDRRCRTTTGNRIAYLQDVDFAPDGTYFVFASTGWVPQTTDEIGTALCDMAARFETDILAPARPTWINYTGGDTLHSVEVTGSAVYVSGHSRWLDNPYGNDFAGPGAVVRAGGGAIDPVSGMALPWNPEQYHQEGGYGFLSTDSGLWHASDGLRFGREYHRGIAFTPLP